MANRLLSLLALTTLASTAVFAGIKPDFSSLPKDLAIVRSEGNGKRVFALFEDPLCPACKYFETQLDSLTDYTVYIYTYPILGRRSVETATGVWCSSDPLRAWEKAVGSRTPLPMNRSCLDTIQKILELGMSHGIRATPTLIFQNDTAVDGAMPAKSLSAMLDRATKSAPAGRSDRQATASTSPSTIAGPKLIEIPGGGPISTPQPKAPAVFVFANGQKIEADDYLVTKDDLFITSNGQKQRYPIRGLDLPGTKAANIERGIVINFPKTTSEFNLNF
jgi:hypothetical protein